MFTSPQRRRSWALRTVSSLFQRERTLARSRRRKRRSEQTEKLEDRALLATFTVTNTLNDGPGSLRAAVVAANAANGADDIVFDIPASGPVITLSTGEITIDDDLTIDGTNLAIDGPITVSGAGASRIFFIDGDAAAIDVLISNLNFANGFADELDLTTALPLGSGGAILNDKAFLELDACTFSNNRSDLEGGAIYGVQGSLTIQQTSFTDNRAGTDGGAVYALSTNTVFRDSVIDNNTAVEDGGGVYAQSGLLQFARSTISDNVANVDGGGLWTEATTLSVDSTWNGNQADDGGAIFVNQFLEFTNSTLSGNTAVMDGAGIYNNDSVTLTNSTLTQNLAGNQGGGIYSDLLSSNILSVYNTLIAGNLKGPGPVFDPSDIEGRGADDTSNNNLIGDPTTAGGLLDGTDGNIVGDGSGGTLVTDDVLDPNLFDNGGATETHALVRGGPAVNAGDNNRAALAGVDRVPDVSTGDVEILNDQRGQDPFLRIYEDIVDIGSFEAQPFVVDTLVDESDGNLARFDLSLREAIELSNLSPSEDAIIFDLQEFDPVLELDEQLVITSDIEINGRNTNLLGGFVILDALADGRILWVDGDSPTEQPKVVLRNMTFSNGHANGSDADLFNTSGGAILNQAAELHLEQVGLLNNESDADGGGIATVQNGVTVITNTTVSGNTSGLNGGGIYNGDSELSVVNSTLANNAAAAAGGGMFSTSNAATETHLYNSLVAGNFGSGSPQDLAGKPVEAGAGNNLIGTSASAGGIIHGVQGNIVGNAGLGNIDVATVIETTARKNGGPHLTHALVPGSLALDNGDDNFAAYPGDDLIPDVSDGDSPLLGDARTLPFQRIFNTSVDIGAIEDQVLMLIVDNTVDELDSDFEAGDFSLREAFRLANENPGVDTITFNFATSNPSIVVLDQLLLTSHIIMDGTNPGGGVVTLNGLGSHRILTVDSSVRSAGADISNMVFANGNADGSDGGLSPQSGGAILSRFARVDVTDVTFRDNQAKDSGGAIYNEDGILLTTRTTFEDNVADRLGGAIANDDGTVSVVTSTFFANHAEIDGGAIFNNNGPMSVVNSTISGNTANIDAGGIYNEDDTVSVVNSTLVNNRADADGNGTGTAGGLLTVDDDVTFTYMFNTLVAGNISGSGTAASDLGGKTPEAESSNNLVGDAASSAGLIDGVNGNVVGNAGVGTIPLDTIVDPVLRFNGGTVRTHSVQVGSAAIDIGDDNRAAHPGPNLIPDIAGEGDPALIFDQRGFPYDRISGDAVDAGAYEVKGEWIVDTTDDVDNQDYSIGDLSLREAIFLSNATPGDVVITFNLPGPAPVITLDEQLVITSNIVIDGENVGGGEVTIDGDGVGRILSVDGLTNSVTVGLTNITLTNGNADGTDAAPFEFEGGAVLNQSGTLWLDNANIVGNTAVDGGGILSRAGEVHVLNSTFSGNSANRGGGLLSFGATSTVVDSRFTGNDATLTGGGIFSRSGTTSVVSSTIWNNTANSGAGVANELNGNLHLTNSTISGNMADNDGGGVSSGIGFVVLTNTTVTGNVADADADATGTGGGVWTDPSGATRVYNSIVAGNSVDNAASPGNLLPSDLGGNAVLGVSSNNLIGDAGSSGGLTDGNNGNVVGNAGVGTIPIGTVLDTTLALNGGSATMTHKLVSGSPAIDIGNNNRAAIPGSNGIPDISADGDVALDFDQRDTPHVRATGNVDAGSYEVTNDWIVSTIGDVNDGIFGFGNFSLREALDTANANPGPDTITFDIGLAQSTILLDGTSLTITEDLTINGLGAGSLTIDADGLSRVFEIAPGATVTLRHLTLTGGDTAGSGGGILNHGTLTIENSTLTGNNAAEGGGIMIQGPTTIVRSEISGNTADIGGGVSSDASQSAAMFENVTISGNTATTVNGVFAGAGVYAYDAVFTFRNSTIANNTSSANGEGAGIAIDDTVLFQEGAVTLINSLVGDNVSTGVGIDVAGDIARLNHTLIETNAGFTIITNDGGNLFLDPGLAPLAVTDGQTATHELVFGSPAINAGNDIEVTSATDQTGQPRQVRRVDMGADERLLQAFDEGVGTLANTPVSISVLDNDNPSSQTEIRGVVSGPADGSTAVIGSDIEYTPDGGFTGVDTFEYEMGVTQQKATGLAADTELGHSVEIDGDWLVVGAQSEDGQNPDGGGVFVYRRSGATWTLFQQLDADDEETLDRFGYDVAIDGTTIVVGARMDDDMGLNSGSAYVFEFDAHQQLWLNSAKLLDLDTGSEKDQFGHAVDIQGDTIVIGARLDDVGGNNSGSMFIFERTSGGWVTDGRIVPADNIKGDQFGYDVAIDGDVIVVGARKDNTGGIDSGSAYIYEKVGNNWVETAELLASNSRRNNWLGFSVDVSGDTVAVGMPIRSNRFRRGEVHIYDRNTGGPDNWGETAILIDTNAEPELDQLGYSVAIDGDVVASGARRDDTIANGAGLVYVYGRDNGGANAWGLTDVVAASDPKAGDNLGRSVALDGTRLAMGAPLKDDAGPRTGAIYVEDLGTSTATVTVTVSSPLMADTLGASQTSDLTPDQLGAIVDAASAWWRSTDLTAAQQLALDSATVTVASLDGVLLGLESGGSVLIDADAAGHGWYVDSTPFDNTDDVLGSRMDLVSAVTHELGHVIGKADIYDPAGSDDIMYGYLSSGERRVGGESATALDVVFGQLAEDDELFGF